jgi:hypothetical protein
MYRLHAHTSGGRVRTAVKNLSTSCALQLRVQVRLYKRQRLGVAFPAPKMLRKLYDFAVCSLDVQRFGPRERNRIPGGGERNRIEFSFVICRQPGGYRNP